MNKVSRQTAGKRMNTPKQMTKGTFLSLLLVIFAVFVSCSQEEVISHGSPLNIKVNTVGVMESRTLIYDLTLPDRAQVGVSVTATDGPSYNGKTYNNILFEATGAGDSQKWNSEEDILLSDVTGILYAYYPYNQDVTDISKVLVETQSQTDYMWGTPVTGLDNTSVVAKVSLNHACSAIQVIIDKGTYTGEGRVSSVSVCSEAVATSALLDARNGALTDFRGTNELIVNRETKTLGKEGASYEILVIPTATQSSLLFTVTVDGTDYVAETAAVQLSSGLMNTYSLSMEEGSKALTITNIQTTDWVSKNYNLPEFSTVLPWCTVTYMVDKEDFMDESLFGLYFSLMDNNLADFIDRIVIDGVEVPVEDYVFESSGIHTAKFLFKDKTIPSMMFMLNLDITEVQLSGKGWSIGAQAFYFCLNLSKQPKWNNISYIEYMAFGATGIESLDLPADWPTVDMMMQDVSFGGFCTSPKMKTINVHPDNPLLYSPDGSNLLVVKEDVLGDGTTMAILGCKNAVFGDNVIGLLDGTFAGVYGPETKDEFLDFLMTETFTKTYEVVLPENLLLYMNGALADNLYLKSLTFSSSDIYTDGNIFYNLFGCPFLDTMISKAETAPSVGYIFDGIAEDGNLYVPQGATGYDEWLQYLPGTWSLQTIQ